MQRRVPEPLVAELGFDAWRMRDGGRLLIAERGSARRTVWDVDRRRPVFGFDRSAVLLPGGNRFLAGLSQAELRGADGELSWQRSSATQGFSMTGAWLPLVENGAIVVANVESGRSVGAAPLPADAVSSRHVVPSSDGEQLAVAQRGLLKLYSLRSNTHATLPAPADCPLPHVDALLWRADAAQLIVSWSCTEEAEGPRVTTYRLAVYADAAFASSVALAGRGARLRLDATGTRVVADDAREASHASVLALDGPIARILSTGVAAHPNPLVLLDSESRLVNVETGAVQGKLGGRFATWSDDGEWILSYDGSWVYVNRASDGSVDRRLPRSEFAAEDSLPSGEFRAGTSDVYFTEPSLLRRPLHWSSNQPPAALSQATRLRVTGLAFAPNGHLLLGTEHFSPTQLPLRCEPGEHVTEFDLARQRVVASTVGPDWGWGVHPTRGLQRRQYRNQRCCRQPDAPGAAIDHACTATSSDGSMAFFLRGGAVHVGPTGSDASAALTPPPAVRIREHGTLSPNGHYLALVVDDAQDQQRLWLTTTKAAASASLLVAAASPVGFLADNRTLITRRRGELRALDVQASLSAGSEVTLGRWPLPGEAWEQAAIALDPTAPGVTWFDGTSLRRYRPGAAEASRPTSVCTQQAAVLDVSPHGRYWALVCRGGLQVWSRERDWSSAFITEALPLSSDPDASTAAFSVDGRLLAIASGDQTHLINVEARTHLTLALLHFSGASAHTSWFVTSDEGYVDGSADALQQLYFPRAARVPPFVPLREVSRAFGFEVHRPNLLSLLDSR